MRNGPGGISRRRELAVLVLCCAAAVTLLILPPNARITVADRLGRVLTAPYWGARNFLDDMATLRRENTRLEHDLFEAELERSAAELARLDRGREAGCAPEEGFGGLLAPCRVTLRQRGRFATMVRITSDRPVPWRPWLPVVNRRGLVGRVRTIVSGTTAWVELMSAPDFALGVEFMRTGLLGVLEPREDRYVVGMVGRDEDVRVGDRVMTSGITEVREGVARSDAAGASPRGIPVGVVTRVDVPNDQVFKYVEIAPAAACRRNETVFVVLPADAEVDRGQEMRP